MVFFWRRKNSHMPTASRITTAPPIAMPAMAPAERLDEDEPLGAAVGVFVPELVDRGVVGSTAVSVPVAVE